MNQISQYAGATLPYPNQKPPIKSPTVSPVLSIFIHKCLYRVPSNRPQARELLANDFLNHHKDRSNQLILPKNLTEIVQKAKQIKFQNEEKDKNNEFNTNNLNELLYQHVASKKQMETPQATDTYHQLPSPSRHNSHHTNHNNILPSPRNITPPNRQIPMYS